jgi:hypothetical protein
VGIAHPLCEKGTFKKAQGKPSKKYLDVKLRGRRTVRRPRLRWNDIRRDSSLLLNIKARNRLTGDTDIWS